MIQPHQRMSSLLSRRCSTRYIIIIKCNVHMQWCASFMCMLYIHIWAAMGLESERLIGEKHHHRPLAWIWKLLKELARYKNTHTTGNRKPNLISGPTVRLVHQSIAKHYRFEHCDYYKVLYGKWGERWCVLFMCFWSNFSRAAVQWQRSIALKTLKFIQSFPGINCK